MRKKIAFIVVFLTIFGIIIPSIKLTIADNPPGTVTILEPNDDPYQEVVYYKSDLFIKFQVTKNPGWIYTGSHIHIHIQRNPNNPRANSVFHPLV